jgi:serralysin
MTDLIVGAADQFDSFQLEVPALYVSYTIHNFDVMGQALTCALPANAQSAMVFTGITDIDSATGIWTGNLSSFSWTLAGTQRFLFQNINIDAALFQSALLAGNGQAILALLFGGDDTIAANALPGWYNLGAGTDTFTGGIGDDYIMSGSGADIINGGGGFDTLDYSRSEFSNGITANETTVIESDGASDTYTDIERIIGTKWSDTFSGSANSLLRQEWIGGAGADVFAGGASYDIVNYHAENLMPGNLPGAGIAVNLSTSTATDRFGHIDKLTSIDELRATDANDVIAGGASGKQVFHLMAGDDTFTGLAADDWISAGAGNDIVNANGGYDIASYAFTDPAPPGFVGIFDFSSGGIVVVGGAISGTASVVDQYGGTDDFTAIERLEGTSAADLFQMGAGKVDLCGLAGADVFIGSTGATIAIDYTVEAQYGGTLGIRADLARGRIIDTFGDADLALGVTSLIATENADIVRGSFRNEWIDVGAGDDDVVGGAGNDWMRPGSGADSCSGGTGFDVIDYSTHALTNAEGLQVALTGHQMGTVQTPDIASDLFETCEVLIGTAGNDSLVAGGFAISFAGGNGADQISAGANSLITMDYGTESTVAGSTRNAVVNLSAESRVVGSTILLSNRAIDTFGKIDTLAGISKVTGTAFSDLFFAGTSSRIHGGLGNDTYYADANDTIVEMPNAGTDTIRSSSSLTLATNVENLQLMATATIATGNASPNAIMGNASNNILSGKLGIDTLSGAMGADRFVFDTVASISNADRITDFAHGVDKIAFAKSVYTTLGTGPRISADSFVSATRALDAEDRIIYNMATGALYYDANGNMAGGALLVAILTSKPALSYTDFLVL